MFACLGQLVTADINGPDRRSGAISTDWLVEHHLDDVYRYAYRLAGNRPDAEDVSQQVFLLAQKHGDQIRDPSCIRPWLMSVVRNTYYKLNRRLRPQNATTANVNIEWFPEEAGNDEVEPDSIQSTINKLDTHHKQVVLMYFFEELSYQQIAEKLNIKIGTVMSRLSRAKANLRELFSSQIR